MAGRYEEAIEAFGELLERAQKGEFDRLIAHNYLASVYAMQGNMKKARFHASEVLKINPNHSLDYNKQTTPLKNPEDLERILDSLRKAGIPEHPPEGPLD
jgi:tetratricopeptide (TPR) repeat protein